MTSPEAHRYGRQQTRWRVLMMLALGCFFLLVLILGDAAFAHLWGLILLLPMLAGGYCCVRSVGAYRKFRRAMAESRKAQQVR